MMHRAPECFVEAASRRFTCGARPHPEDWTKWGAAPSAPVQGMAQKELRPTKAVSACRAIDVQEDKASSSAASNLLCGGYNAEPARNPIWCHSSRRQARDDRASGPPYEMWNFLFFIAVCGT